MNSAAVPIGVWLVAIAAFAIAGQAAPNAVWRERFQAVGFGLACTLVIMLATVGLVLVVTL
ncbi:MULTISPECIES: hypothetical protein [unclassified Nocardia]|uniref:hypothetical protein n=1 Tax=unclassified Nocardia TaxID=2637762 RepID=UPI00278BEB8F|nr:MULTISPECIES: hypothetical protein [unclassified Nocardia]